MAEPTEVALKTAIRKLVAKVDLEVTGIKKFTKLLRKEFGGIDLSHKSKFIKKTLTEVINEADDEDDDGDEDSVDVSEEEEEEEVAKPAKKKKKGTGGGGGGGGLAAVKEISDKMAAFLGKGKHMARTEIVKMLWEHIKENNLQNPENKREIILDDALKGVFGRDVDTFTMFTMNKYVGAHIDPFKPVDLTTNSTQPKKRKTTTKSKGEKKKRKGGGGLQAPYQLSPELARVVGRQILPRPRVVKYLWEYIREHNLQDPSDKRTIICDAKLKLVMSGEKTVTIFSMQKHLSPHLLEKLDTSYYTPSDAEEEVDDNDDE